MAHHWYIYVSVVSHTLQLSGWDQDQEFTATEWRVCPGPVPDQSHQIISGTRTRTRKRDRDWNQDQDQSWKTETGTRTQVGNSDWNQDQDLDWRAAGTRTRTGTGTRTRSRN